MLLLLLTALCFHAVKGSLYYEEVCYGGNYVMPISNMPNGDVHFTPRNGGERKLIMNSTKKLLDPRYKVTQSSFSVLDVREGDEGTFSRSLYGRPLSVLTLRVKDCSEPYSFYYGERLSRSVSNKAEYIEFTPTGQVDKTVVLWNRTAPRTSRGTMRNNVWSMSKLTQSDNGHYNIRRKDNSLLRRWKITIEAHSEQYQETATEELHIGCNLDREQLTMTFKPENGMYGMDDIVLIKSGRIVSHYSDQFSERLRIEETSQLTILINDLHPADSGLYEFSDENNNVALAVTLTVLDEAPTFLYVGIGAGIILGLTLCCCCVKRCCCGKSSSKGGDAPQTPDEPEEDRDPSRAGLTTFSSSPHLPRYTYYQPTNPTNSTTPTAISTDPPAAQPAAKSKVNYYKPLINPPEPTSTSINPPAYVPADMHVSSLHPEVQPIGGQGASPSVTLGSDSLSSTADHRFELKFPSAPPLSAEATFPSVYNSDKLNFC